MRVGVQHSLTKRGIISAILQIANGKMQLLIEKIIILLIVKILMALLH